jgi:uncharacterized protein YecT (DUF1311 family)
MLKYVSLIGLNLLLSLGFASVGQAASFDCNKATTETEIAICADPELSALDELMGQAYRLAKTSADWMTPQELRNSQKAWLQQRNRCSENFDCLRSSYVQRLEEVSSGVLHINVGRNSASYVYQGEPVSGVCRSGTKLADWGECVSWFRGGLSFRGLSAAGAMAFSFVYVGANTHTCSLSGRADKVNGLWIFQDDSSTCALRIEVGAAGLSLNPTPECNNYCGMRAQGAMEQIIEY